MKKALSQSDVLDIIDTINTEEIGFIRQPILSAIEIYDRRATRRNMESVAHALGINIKTLFADRGVFEAVKDSELQINVPAETLKIYCYIIDAYFSVLPDTVISRIKKAMGAKYPDAVVEMLKRIEKKEVERIFSCYGNETEAKIIISLASTLSPNHFHYLLSKNGIPFFDFFDSLKRIEQAVFDLKRCYLKDYLRELKRVKKVVVQEQATLKVP
jgi:hypothetical protein